MIKHVVLVSFFLLPHGIAAQDVIQTVPNDSPISGEIVTLPNDSDASGRTNNLPEEPGQPIVPPANWTTNNDFQMPSYGIGVFGENGELLDLFGPGTPLSSSDGTITIPDYELPEGAHFRTLSAEDATKAYQSRSKYFAETAIEGTIDAISNGTNYVAEKLCDDPARPTRITLSLEGGFSFGITATSGSEVEWNLPELCARYQATSDLARETE